MFPTRVLLHVRVYAQEVKEKREESDKEREGERGRESEVLYENPPETKQT